MQQVCDGEPSNFFCNGPCPHAVSDAVSISFGDDQQTVYVSYNGGNTFTQIGNEGNWQNELSLSLTTITEDTILRYVVTDGGAVGGFMGIIQYNGYEYPITNPLSDGI